MAAIYELKLDGNYDIAVYRALGIPASTWNSWIARGSDPKHRRSIYRRLLDTLEKAEAEAEANLVRIMLIHARKNFNAAGWLLERRFSARWAKKDEHREPEDRLKQMEAFSARFDMGP